LRFPLRLPALLLLEQTGIVSFLSAGFLSYFFTSLSGGHGGKVVLAS
jgi:hypothetical protein